MARMTKVTAVTIDAEFRAEQLPELDVELSISYLTILRSPSSP